MTPPDTKLSRNFTFGELTRTSHGNLLETNRQEAEVVVDKLRELCVILLEPVRAKYGPVKIHSGFRGPAVNAAVGSKSSTSQHTKGEAVDFSVPGHKLDDVFRWIVTSSGIPFGQAILEGKQAGVATWIHLSLGKPYRAADRCGQALTCYDGKTYNKWNA
jgi:zinc D-Ala-D-Ala carboxypeptidase